MKLRREQIGVVAPFALSSEWRFIELSPEYTLFVLTMAPHGAV
jgi:hypothetical protein